MIWGLVKNKKELRKPRSFFLGFFVFKDHLDQFWDLAGKIQVNLTWTLVLKLANSLLWGLSIKKKKA